MDPQFTNQSTRPGRWRIDSQLSAVPSDRIDPEVLATTIRARPHEYPALLDVRGEWLTLCVLAIYSASLIAEGALRFYLAAAGATPLIYLRDILLTAVTLWYVAMAPRRKEVWVVGCALLIGAFVGLQSGYSILEVAFGLKMFLPLVSGLCLFPVIRQAAVRPWLRVIAWLCFVAACTFIFINCAVDLPWDGFSYTVGDHEVQANIKWFADGVPRVAGLSRSSYEAAVGIALFGTFLFSTFRRLLIRVFVFVVGSAAVFLTTSKGILGAVAVVAILGTFGRIYGERSVRQFRELASWIVVGALVSLPLASYIWHLRIDGAGGASGVFQLSSLDDRVSDVWPEAMHQVLDSGTAITGLGLGSIGGPAMLDGAGTGNPGDNLFVYLCSIYGIWSVLPVGAVAYGLSRLGSRGGPLEPWFQAGFIVLVYGITTNLVESPIAGFVLGALISSCRDINLRDRWVHLPNSGRLIGWRGNG